MHNAKKTTFNLDVGLYEDLMRIKDTELGHNMTQLLNRGAKLARDEFLEQRVRQRKRRETFQNCTDRFDQL